MNKLPPRIPLTIYATQPSNEAKCQMTIDSLDITLLALSQSIQQVFHLPAGPFQFIVAGRVDSGHPALAHLTLGESLLDDQRTFEYHSSAGGIICCSLSA
ncbi:MAG: hypothetical protein AB7P16_27635 [Bradyrhizobium sp.]|uniref:hypothetical protein n=1 Tax=Bradyrhizobium sp. TaxID=376 RepID=UPI003D123EC5